MTVVGNPSFFLRPRLRGVFFGKRDATKCAAGRAPQAGPLKQVCGEERFSRGVPVLNAIAAAGVSKA